MDTDAIGAVAFVAAGVAAAAFAGRWTARRLGQPEIVLEIAASLLLGWVLVSQAGWGSPGSAGREALAQVGHVGLALFLVGAAHEIQLGGGRLAGRAVAWLSAGSALPPLACGALFAVWVLHAGEPALRGTAPSPALVLMLAVSLAVTAVPVLAGILRDRRMENTHVGRLAMASAVPMDAVTWVLLAVAIGFTTGGHGVLQATAVLAGGIPVALAVRRFAHTGRVGAFAAAHPHATLVLVAVAAYAASQTTARLGLTDIFGAVLVGFALPADGPWSRVGRVLGRTGRLLLPILFTITGTALASGPDSAPHWTAIVAAIVLATVSKLAGSYAGARLGGQSHVAGLRLATLMNTRGLTEIAVLQAGYGAGILTPDLFLALIVMALTTTGLSGPLLWAIDRYYGAVPAKPEPALQSIER